MLALELRIEKPVKLKFCDHSQICIHCQEMDDKTLIERLQNVKEKCFVSCNMLKEKGYVVFSWEFKNGILSYTGFSEYPLFGFKNVDSEKKWFG